MFGHSAFAEAPFAALADAGAAEQNLAIGFLGASGALYTPALASAANLPVGFLAAAGALYAPVLAPGNIDAAIGFLQASGVLYAPALTASNDLAIPFLGAGGALYAPTLSPGAVDLPIPFLAANGAIYALSLAQPVDPHPDRTITLGRELRAVALGVFVGDIVLGEHLRHVEVDRGERAIVLGADGMADTGRWDKKDPEEALFYSLDWQLPLDGDVIQSATWEAPAAITIANESVDGAVTRAKLSGGVDGTDYDVTVTVLTTGGQTLQRSRKLKVRTR